MQSVGQLNGEKGVSVTSESLNDRRSVELEDGEPAGKRLMVENSAVSLDESSESEEEYFTADDGSEDDEEYFTADEGYDNEPYLDSPTPSAQSSPKALGPVLEHSPDLSLLPSSISPLGGLLCAENTD